MSWKLVAAVLTSVCASAGAWAADAQVLNVYSARHYASDEALYRGFTAATGIQIQRVDSDDTAILARLQAEGASSPADVVLLVDASRLWKGEADGMFKPVQSATLQAAIPASLRAQATPQGTAWFGLSTRARVVVYDKLKVKRSDIDTYEKLADPVNAGRLCVRSGAHPYNLSLFGAMTAHIGADKTQAWLKGLVANMARSPKGGDTDQIKAVASGECAIALTNSYYLARLMRSSNPDDQRVVERVGVVFPNQSSWGTHINIAGGAVARYSRQPALAVRFLEYLVSPAAQAHFANGNNEWSVIEGVQVDNPALKAMTRQGVKFDPLPVSAVGPYMAQTQQMLDRAGFK
jgi:iron(III) transport system substrate-binding protein